MSGHPLVIVEWSDILSISDWRDFEDVLTDKPVSCVTAGFLVRDDRELVVVAATISNDDGHEGVGDTVAIPRGVVKKITRITKK